MDNGLIFPYPRKSAHDEPRCANHPNWLEAFGLRLGSVGTWWVVVKRWGDAGR